MREQGYVRDADQREHDGAVRWWYVRTMSHGGLFARGGRVRTAREARRIIDDLHRCFDAEERMVSQMRRPRYRLLADGALKMIQR